MEDGGPPDARDVGLHFPPRRSGGEARSQEDTFELCEERLRGHQLEVATPPAVEELSRRTGGHEKARVLCEAGTPERLIGPSDE